MDSPPSYPDGLTRDIIDALVAEVDAAVHPVRGVPLLFADRDAALRREHCRADHALERVARSLPPVSPVAADGEQAA
jgi:hypothetical protein